MNRNDGRHMFGIVKVGEKGQIVIPRDARRIFDIRAGDSIMVLGDEKERALALLKAEDIVSYAAELLGMNETTEEDEK